MYFSTLRLNVLFRLGAHGFNVGGGRFGVTHSEETGWTTEGSITGGGALGSDACVCGSGMAASPEVLCTNQYSMRYG